MRASRLCADAMQSAVVAAREVAAPSIPAASTEKALKRLEHCAKTLDELQRAHRSATLSAVASGAVTGGEASARVDAVQRLDAFAYHAWRSAAHLVGRA